MYSVVRIFEGDGSPAPDGPEVTPSRADDLLAATGCVTLLVIKGDDDSRVTVEIFETLDDLTAAHGGGAGRLAHRWPSPAGPERGRTITGEIVFQRGL
jgi:hypothetical protein